MEALGIASSVFAAASLELQLSSNIRKLIELWDSGEMAQYEIAQRQPTECNGPHSSNTAEMNHGLLLVKNLEEDFSLFRIW